MKRKILILFLIMVSIIILAAAPTFIQEDAPDGMAAKVMWVDSIKSLSSNTINSPVPDSTFHSAYSWDSDKWDTYQFADYLNQDVKYTASPKWTNVGFRTTASALWEIGAVSANKFFIRSITIDDTLMVWDRVNTKIDFQDKDIDNIDDATIEGELKGSRQNFGAGENSAKTDDAYMKTFNGVVMSGTQGYVMHRAGSIVGVSMLANCTVYSGIGTAEIEVWKAGAEVFSKSTSVTATGIIKAYDTQARGIDTFVAGDVIALRYDKISGTFTLNSFVCYVEVVFDD